MAELKKIPVWLDCDPGHDDAMAIVLAAWHPRLHLLGISTVGGNQSLAKVTVNAAKMLYVAGAAAQGISVHPGAAKPLLRPEFHDPEIHGDSGLDGSAFLPSSYPPHLIPSRIQGADSLHHGVTEIAKAVMAADEPVTLVATGSLTNIALLFSMYPHLLPPHPPDTQLLPEEASPSSLSSSSAASNDRQVGNEAVVSASASAAGSLNSSTLLHDTPADHRKSQQQQQQHYHNHHHHRQQGQFVRGGNYVKALVLMGGAMTRGNRSPVAEFNILVDPDAAQIVFQLGPRLPITMVPLEVTHTALATEDVLCEIYRRCALKTAVHESDANDAVSLSSSSSSSNFGRLIVDLLTFFKETYFRVFSFADPPVHDPCAVLFVAEPELFETKLMRVDVETASQLCRGQTVCDIWRASPLPPNVHVALRMDVKRFWASMIAALECANQASPLNP